MKRMCTLQGGNSMRQKFSRSMFSFMVVLVMVVSLILVGCSDDDAGDDEGEFVDATPALLENNTWAFTDCVAFDPALDGAPCTLSIGDCVEDADEPETGNCTFTLTAGASTASGIVTISSCNYDVTSSTFPTGLTVGEQFTHDPCEIDEVSGAYRGTNEETGEEATGTLTGTGGGGS
jgi:hypothetical protein